VLYADRWLDRWRGVKTGFDRVLLATDSVHSRGLGKPLQLVGVDGSGIVVAVSRLDPGSFARLRGASWILELPVVDEPPAVGSVLSIYPRPRDWKTDTMRHADRQPR
jgi:hypothetical protein